MPRYSNITYLYPGHWSPDGKHVVAKAWAFNYKYLIVRIEASGDKRTYVDMTPTSLDPYQEKTVIGWRANVPTYDVP